MRLPIARAADPEKGRLAVFRITTGCGMAAADKTSHSRAS
jgi:hypothetical protein